MGHQIDQKSQAQSETEEIEQVQNRKLSPNDDYQSEFIPYSRASALAAAGDSGARQEEGARFRLPPIAFDTTHALEMSARYRAQAERYNISRLGRGTQAAAFRECTAAANAYQTDARNMETSGIAYNAFAPLAAHAVDEVIRFKTIQSGLGDAFDETLSPLGSGLSTDSLTAQVADRQTEFADALHSGDIKTTKGLVSDAASAFSAAQTALYASLYRLQGSEMRQVIHQLHEQRSAKTAEKNKVHAKIAAAQQLFDGVGHFLSVGSNALSPPTGALEIGKKAVDAAGFVAGRISGALHDQELAVIESRLSTIDQELAAAESAAGKADSMGLRLEVKAAIEMYRSALHRYENAIASRRTAYAKAGATADQRHVRGREVKHGDDKASQTMLFVSAARETAVALRVALKLAPDVEKPLRTTLEGMRHRGRSVMIDDWERVRGETESPDRERVFTAYSLTNRWIEASQAESDAFNRIDTIAAAMLKGTGKATGTY